MRKSDVPTTHMKIGMLTIIIVSACVQSAHAQYATTQYDSTLALIQKAASANPAVDAKEWQQFAHDTAEKLANDSTLYVKLKNRFLAETNALARLRFGQILHTYFLTQIDTVVNSRPVDSDILISMYSDPDPDIRVLALLPLRKAKGELYYLLQSKYLYDTEATTRYVALRHFGRRVGNMGIPYYITLLKDPDQTVRAEAISAIMECEEKVYLVPLLRNVMLFDTKDTTDKLALGDLSDKLLPNSNKSGDPANTPERQKSAIATYLQMRIEILSATRP